LVRASSRRLALAALLAPLALSRAAAAQAPTTPLPGRIVAREAVAGDSAQHVAAYFPSRFDRARAVPVLFVLDPRGRAELALRLFAGGAERHGWLVVSSYNSASDTDGNPNVDAMNAMLSWTQQNAQMDTTRIYLAGFSGTARIAWGLAAELRPRVAGMFGTGGGVSFSAGGPEMAFGADSTFAFFGSAGTTDFNYDEMRGLATRLRLARVPSRMAWFRGPHAWPPQWMCEQAVDWLELRAMLGGRRAVDTAFMAHALAQDLAYADSLERAGQWDAAETRFREIALDAPSRPEGRQGLTRADDLALREPLRALRERARELAREDQKDLAREYAGLREARTAQPPLEPDVLLGRLGVEALRRRAASPDSLARDAAMRRLSNIAAFISFYEPRAFLAAAEPQRAATSLRAAAVLGPLRGESCALVRTTASLLPPDDARRLPDCP
jgi:predicted esterase